MRLVSAKFVPCGFCITMTHRATHGLLCSNSSPRKAFLSSPNHRTFWISLRGTFGCSLFWKYASRGRVSHHGGHRIECDGWTPEDSKRSLPPVHPTMAGSMEQVCVCVRVWFWRWLDKRCHMSYHYSAIPQFRELCDCPSYMTYGRARNCQTSLSPADKKNPNSAIPGEKACSLSLSSPLRYYDNRRR